MNQSQRIAVGKVLRKIPFYLWFKENIQGLEALLCLCHYRRQLKRLKQKAKSEKIRVLFIVSEMAKWKEQRLYELMERSEHFDPIVGLSDWNSQAENRMSNDELLVVHEKAEKFFDQLGDKHVRTVLVENGKRIHIDLRQFNPDIVFYTEAWWPNKQQDPRVVSRFALTFLAPYYTPNYGWLANDCHLLVQRLCYGYFCFSEAWCEAFRKSLRWIYHCSRFIPVGHPALDFFSKALTTPSSGDLVIYAPHFSFAYGRENAAQIYSTFDWNGRAILDYAKRHPEFNWVFKPHPLLRTTLIQTGFMTQDEIRVYFDAWAKIGTVCEDGDYQHLFLESRAMITDCGSFLTEYGATGRPVIHLISARNQLKPIALMGNVYATYYKVHTIDEMNSIFKLVLEDRQDPNRTSRIFEARRAGICESNASDRIMQYLEDLLS